MKKVLQIFGGLAVLAIVLVAGIVMGMEHNKSSDNKTEATEQVVKTKKKATPKKKVVKKETKSDDTDSNEDTKKDTEEKKKYLDVPYTCTYQQKTYTLLLKSDGEYIYNFKDINEGSALKRVNMEKGTYEINSGGLIEYKRQINYLSAAWNRPEDIFSTTPVDVTFTGRGSRVNNEHEKAFNNNDFTIINDGEEIQGNGDGIDLMPQPGLEVKDPEKVGPGLKKQYVDSQDY